jgi:hypothetical protein
MLNTEASNKKIDSTLFKPKRPNQQNRIMEFIAHRINTVEELKSLDRSFGVELDVRDGAKELILQHDPYKDGERFEDFLKHYQHGTMIVNIKSERIEEEILTLLSKYGIIDFFFLDNAFPVVVELSNKGISNIALKYSEYQGTDTIEIMKDRVDWLWIDCYTRFSLDKETYKKFKSWGYKLCYGSPELYGRNADLEIYNDQIEAEEIRFDAVCTKFYNKDRHFNPT